VLGQLLVGERSFDGTAAALPAFPAVWALLAAWLYAQSWQKHALWYGIAAVISVSCITTGMHSLIDLTGSLLVFVIAAGRTFLWYRSLQLSEWFPNSLKEWRFGKVRVINHGFYVGAGSFTGALIVLSLSGESQFWNVVIIPFSTVLGAGLWGQALEGSSTLSRPFGFYGEVFGGCAAVFVVSALGADGMRIGQRRKLRCATDKRIWGAGNRGIQYGKCRNGALARCGPRY
jgi:hypothetical protein